MGLPARHARAQLPSTVLQMVLCEDTYKCTWKDVDAMLAQLLGARRGYEDVISNARHRSKDVGMVLVAQIPWVITHGRGCVDLPGLRGDAKRTPSEALLLTFLNSPLSRSVGEESRRKESDWPLRANGGGFLDSQRGQKRQCFKNPKITASEMGNL